MSKVEIQFSNGKIIGKKDVPILYDPNHKIYSGGYTIPNPALSSLNEKKLKNMLVENETVLLQYFWNLANKFEWSDQSEIDPAKIRKIVYLLTRPRIVKLTETITFDKALLVKEMMDLLITERLKELGSETKKFLSDKGKNETKKILSHVIAKGQDYYMMVVQCPQIIEYLVQNKLYQNFYSVFNQIDGIEEENWDEESDESEDELSEVLEGELSEVSEDVLSEVLEEELSELSEVLEEESTEVLEESE